MSKFFQYSLGRWLNLDDVKSIYQHYNRKDYKTTTFFNMRGGEQHESMQPFEPSLYNSTVVPAVPGAHFVVASCYNGVDDNGRPDICVIWTEPVIAWSVPPDNDEDRYPIPVFFNPIGHDRTAAYAQCDGTYRIAEDTTFASLKDYENEMLRRAQEKWDSEHG